MTKKVSQALERKRPPVGAHRRVEPAVKGTAHTHHAHARPSPTTSNRHQRKRRSRRWNIGLTAALVVVGAIGVLALLFALSHQSPTGTSQASQYAYVVGNPGPGEVAPPIQLPATTGGTFDLAAQHGKTVLLFFQEGIGCQSCWDQLKDVEAHWSDFRALGIDEMVSISGNALDVLKQKGADEGLSTPLLADPDLAVSKTYGANQYGMMGISADGHSFIVVGPDGRIRWRADYGGPPNYTMYVPIPTLLADLRKGMTGATS